MQFKTQFNATPVKGELNTMPSQTVPDETMSIQEILRRYAKGLPIGGAKVPLYDGEEDYYPDPRTLDLAEREQMAREAQNTIQDIKQKQLKHDEEKKLRKLQAEAEAKAKAEQAAATGGNGTPGRKDS